MLARWTPFQELFTLQRDLMNLFGRVFGEQGVQPAAFVPAMDAYYKDGHLIVRAELAGVDPKTVDVSYTGRTLTIRGERIAPEIPADDRILGEIFYGKFERSITLPEGLDTEQISARWQEGILEVKIPVARDLLPRRIPIETARA